MLTESRFSPSDIIVAIFVAASTKTEGGRDGRCVFLAHNSALQREFWALQKKYRRGVLVNFLFSDSGPDPFSPNLDDALLVSLSRYDSGNAEPFMISSPMRTGYLNDIHELFAPEELREISAIADEILRKIPHRLHPW